MSKNIGFLGLGKLGLPCALAMESSGGYSITGFDLSQDVINNIKQQKVTYHEKGVNELLLKSKINVLSNSEDLVKECDIIFIAVQTPHEKNYEGITPTPAVSKDFDYTFLIDATTSIANGLKKYPDSNPLIVIISTCLPGTIRSQILPILKSARTDFRFAYNPYFIAMGTTIDDFLNPEFLLIGSESESDAAALSNFYKFLNCPTAIMSIEEAELTKVSYNTFIGLKIIFANTIGEISRKLGLNSDNITKALALGKRRILSPMYLSAGMADGGGLSSPRPNCNDLFFRKNRDKK